MQIFIKLFCYIKIKYYICSTEMNQLTLTTMSTTDYQYKITYHPTLMACMFVRIKDDVILYCNDNESNVKLFADGFCAAKNISYYIE